jgi:hypothetical protein
MTIEENQKRLSQVANLQLQPMPYSTGSNQSVTNREGGRLNANPLNLPRTFPRHSVLRLYSRHGACRGLKESIESNRKERSHEPERSEELAWQESLSGSSLTRCFLTIDDAVEAGYTYDQGCRLGLP